MVVVRKYCISTSMVTPNADGLLVELSEYSETSWTHQKENQQTPHSSPSIILE
jgi:hypothetical protein